MSGGATLTPTLAGVDAALEGWRARVAAAGRNVAELSELPEFAALKAAARVRSGAGGGGGDAGRVVATVDELWQGVLLLNAMLTRAEAARAAAGRLWMPGEIGAVVRILEGPSISVALGASPVLHRRLLGGATDTAVVSPGELLATMEGAFDTARTMLARIAGAAEAVGVLRAQLLAAVGGVAGELPGRAAELAVRVGARESDPVGTLDALEALRPAVDAACAGAATLRAARERLARLGVLRDGLEDAMGRAGPLVAGLVPPVPPGELAELPGWLDRLGRTLDTERTEAFTVGLASWSLLAERGTAFWQAALDGVVGALAVREELRGRFGALQAKHRARHPGPDAALDGIAAELRAALAGASDLVAARRAMVAYEARLARPALAAGRG